MLNLILKKLKNKDTQFWILLFIYIAFIFSGHLKLSLITCGVIAIKYIYTYIDLIKTNIKRLKHIGILISGLYFFYLVLANKSLNNQFEIEVEYLKYSPYAYAFTQGIIVSISIVLSLLLIFIFFKVLFEGTIKSSLSAKSSVELILLLHIMIIPTKVNALFNEYNVIKYILLLDAHTYSDCRIETPQSPMAKNSAIQYIRKNNSSCYKVNWPSFFEVPQYESFEQPKK